MTVRLPDFSDTDLALYKIALENGVKGYGTNTPPGSPVQDDCYIIGSSPTGAWVGSANKVAVYDGGAWAYIPTSGAIGSAQRNLALSENGGNKTYRWFGSEWIEYAAPTRLVDHQNTVDPFPQYALRYEVSTGSGSGDVTKVGTPVNNELGVWTGNGTLEGEADLTYDGTDLRIAANITELKDVTFQTGAVGGTLRTGTSAADKIEMQAYDVNGGFYQKVLEIDAGNTPQLEVFADSFRIWDNADETKRLFFTLSGGTAGVTTELITSPTANRQITFPDATCTLANAADTVTGPVSSVDNEIALFSGVGGKTIKRASTTGVLKATSGVIAAAVSGTDYAPATSGTSVLKGNGSGGFSNAVDGTDLYSSAYAIPNANIGHGIENASRAAQSQVVVSGTNYYITRSNLLLPASSKTGGGMVVGTRFHWRVALTKTAAGTGTFRMIIYRGTNGSTADTADVTQTLGTQTAAVDNMTVEVMVTVTTTGATGAYYWTIIPQNKAVTATGFGIATGTGAFFDGTVSSVALNTASLQFGLGFVSNTGTPTIRIPMMHGRVFNMT
jgi:hypothetical protein